MNELTAILRHDAVRLCATTGETKDLSYSEFLQYMQRHVGMLDDEVKSSSFTSRLPRSCVWLKISKSEIKMALYFPESVETLTHTNRVYEKCVTPNIIVMVTLGPTKGATARSGEAFPSSWFVSDARWFSTSKSSEELTFPIDHRASSDNVSNQIWYLPVGNIYDDYRMCIGSNPYPDVKNSDFRVMDSFFYDIFVRGVFNNDLHVHDVNFSVSNTEILNLYSKCHRFPYEIMRNYSGPHTRVSSASDAIRNQEVELDKEKLAKLNELIKWADGKGAPYVSSRTKELERERDFAKQMLRDKVTELKDMTLRYQHLDQKYIEMLEMLKSIKKAAEAEAEAGTEPIVEVEAEVKAISKRVRKSKAV